MADRKGTASSNVAMINRIYEILDGIDGDLSMLRRHYDHGAKVDVFEAQSIFDGVELLDGWGYGSRLGIAATDAAKFDRIQGKVSRETLLHLGERVPHLLRELEGEVAIDLPSSLQASPSEPSKPTTDSASEKEQAVVAGVSADKWVLLHRSRNAELISNISSLIDEAIGLSKGTNLPPDRQALSAIERAELIALLETALQILKAPLAELGLLKKLRQAAQSGAASAVQKKTELALGYGLGRLAELIVKLLSGLR